METDLVSLSASVVSSKSLEELVRPLLEMLASLTGLESAYLTSVDEEKGVQRVDFALNTGQLTLPEQLTVPWGDTLCKRALEEGRPFCSDVDTVWGDSQTAAALGIRTYVSAPIRGKDGRLLGTLCAASKATKDLAPRAQAGLNLFSKLIAQHIEREHLVESLRQANERLERSSLTDPLTQLPNRRALVSLLETRLKECHSAKCAFLVALIDIDDFKSVNDRYGHVAGDEVLSLVARRLELAVRSGDLVCRYGGDEFVVVTADATVEQTEDGALAFEGRLAKATVGEYKLSDGRRLLYCGASVGTVQLDKAPNADEALRMADDAMYQEKRRRALARRGTPCWTEVGDPDGG
jgi:diguanylate cyclase